MGKSLDDSPQFDHRSYLYRPLSVPGYDRILTLISTCNDPAKLRQWIYNANKRQAFEVRNAAYRQLSEIAHRAGASNMNNIGYRILAVYQTRLTSSRCCNVKMKKFKELLRDSGGVALLRDLLGRQRYQKISQSLVDMELADLTIEAAILAYASQFEQDEVDTARELLKLYGFKGRMSKYKI